MSLRPYPGAPWQDPRKVQRAQMTLEERAKDDLVQKMGRQCDRKADRHMAVVLWATDRLGTWWMPDGWRRHVEALRAGRDRQRRMKQPLTTSPANPA